MHGPTIPVPLLEARGLTIEFPGVRALDGVALSLRPGEIHALMGENGAGKSTLIKVLTGLYTPSAGEIFVGGARVEPKSPRDAERFGVSTVYQEVDLIPTMPVADNICLGRQPRKLGLVDRRAMRERARRALARLELDLDVSRLLSEYSIAVQQMVAISRALDVEARVLILDEPTSSLDADETRELFRVLGRLRGEGLSIVLVTHFLDHVDQFADHVTVLRNGKLVGSWPKRDLPRPALVEAMTGRTFESLHTPTPTTSPTTSAAASTAAGEAVLAVDGLGRKRTLEPTTVAVRAGESLGLAGLLGSGRTELARLIFGADAADRGSIAVRGAPIKPGAVRDAINRGIAMCPEDRKRDGVLLDLSVRENIILAMQARRGPLSPVPSAEQHRLADHYIKSLRIKTPSPETPVRNLSGGNQQKVLLARWLAMQPSVLILDEPTRGIDIGAKAEIEALVESLRKQGLAIIFISSEIEETLRACDRVLVLRDRAVVGELSGGALTEPAILGMIAQPTPTHSQPSAEPRP